MLLHVSLLSIIVITHGMEGFFQLIENNIDEHALNPRIGSWSNWFTGYRVNSHRNGYLDIGNVKFNISNLRLIYTLNTNCTDHYPLFVNGRIHCVSNNMLYSYNASKGSLSFWYLSTHEFLQNPIFSMSKDYASVLIFAPVSGRLYISSFNATSGGLDRTSLIRYWWSSDGYMMAPPSLYPVGSSDGYIYFTSKPSLLVDVSVYAYNIETYQFIANDPDITNGIYTPTICNDLVAISGYNVQTMAYNTPNLQQQWIFDGRGPESTTEVLPGPVCIKNKNGYRMIVKNVNNSDCYMLDANNGAEINQFQCGSAAPIFHYDKKSGFADIVILSTDDTGKEKKYLNLITVAEMKRDKIISKVLWSGEGDIDHGFIVDDYFVTGFIKGNLYTLNVRIYNIFDGDIVWERVYEDLVYDFTYSVFGGLVSQNYSNQSAPMRLMIMTRVDDKLYGYYMFEES
eukprot:440010_1